MSAPLLPFPPPPVPPTSLKIHDLFFNYWSNNLHCPLLASSLLSWPLVPGVHLSDWCLTPRISENSALLTSLSLAHCPLQKSTIPSCFCKWDDSVLWLANILFSVCCILFISPFSNKSVNRLTLALPIVNSGAVSTGTALTLFLFFTNSLRILYFEPIHSLLSAFQDSSQPHTSLPAQFLCSLFFPIYAAYCS